MDKINNNLTCTEMYTRPTGTVIGYDEEPTWNLFRNSLNTGELCKSGIALIRNKTTAVCAEITSVKTNIDNFATDRKAGPFNCSLNITYPTP